MRGAAHNPKPLLELGERRVVPQHNHPGFRIVAVQGGRDLLPFGLRVGGVDLPPVGEELVRVNLLDGEGQHFAVLAESFRKDHLQHQTPLQRIADRLQLLEQGELLPLFLCFQMRMEVPQHLHEPSAGALNEVFVKILFGQPLHRKRTRSLNRGAHMIIPIGRLLKDVSAKLRVHEQGQRLATVLGIDPLEALEHQVFELADLRRGDPLQRAGLLELPPVIKSQHLQWQVSRSPQHRALVQLQQGGTGQHLGVAVKVFDQVLQFVEGGHRGGAAVTGHGEGAVSIAPQGAGFQRLVPQPAPQKSGGKRISRPKDVQHLNRKGSRLDGRGGTGGEDFTALLSALEDNRCRGKFPDGLKRGFQRCHPARNHHLLLGANDQVKVRKQRLQHTGDGFGSDKARLPIACCGQAPQHGAVVNVEDHGASSLLSDFDRVFAGFQHGRSGEAGSCEL